MKCTYRFSCKENTIKLKFLIIRLRSFIVLTVEFLSTILLLTEVIPLWTISCRKKLMSLKCLAGTIDISLRHYHAIHYISIHTMNKFHPRDANSIIYIHNFAAYSRMLHKPSRYMAKHHFAHYINCYKLLASRWVECSRMQFSLLNNFDLAPCEQNRSPQHSFRSIYKVFYTPKRQVSDSDEHVHAHHSPSVAFALSCKLWLQEVYLHYTLLFPHPSRFWVSNNKGKSLGCAWEKSTYIDTEYTGRSHQRHAQSKETAA